MDILNTKIKNILTEKTNKIRPENIKSGVNILGISGNVVELAGETKNVTPSTSAQTITPSTGKNGITQINVSAVDNTIDNNIQQGNIKNGVTILGVQGNYTGTVPSGTINITQNGTVDVTNYASADVSVSSGGGKNTQINNIMHITSFSAYTKGIEITVAKTGIYKVTRQLRRIETSGTWGSQLYINGTAYGNANETWGMQYYLNNDTNPSSSIEWQQIIEEHVSLNEGDVIASYGRSKANANWLYHVYLLIEEE